MLKGQHKIETKNNVPEILENLKENLLAEFIST